MPCSTTGGSLATEGGGQAGGGLRGDRRLEATGLGVAGRAGGGGGGGGGGGSLPGTLGRKPRLHCNDAAAPAPVRKRKLHAAVDGEGGDDEDCAGARPGKEARLGLGHGVAAAAKPSGAASSPSSLRCEQ